MRISPFEGYLVNPERAPVVVSPAYDALTPAQRHQFATTHPQNYLNVMRSHEEYPPGECPSVDQLLRTNAQTLGRMMARGDFVPRPTPSLYLYRLREGAHVQTGVVAEVPVEEYESGLVKKHEHTQADKEDDLTRYQSRVRASSSPICLTYPPDAAIDDYVTVLSQRTPVIDFEDAEGIQQTVWVLDDGEAVFALQELFENVPVSYLTDGHHRTASATRFRDLEREANSAHTGDEPYNQLLVAFFPSNQLRILEYNRCVKGLNGHSRAGLLEVLEGNFSVSPWERQGEAVRPRVKGEFSMFVEDHWYRLTVHAGVVPDDPVSGLDVSVLQDRILAPILGIADPRTDTRMSYLSGAFDMTQLQEHCRENDVLGFAVYPTEIEDLMAVADAGEVMPPKSTWFDPKLRSGVFLRMR